MINELTQLLKCDKFTAYKVFDQMCEDGIDFSECTQRQFNKYAKEAYKTVQKKS